MRVLSINSSRECLGLKMKIESEGHKVSNDAPNPDCVIVCDKKYKGSTPAFNGGDWAYSINTSSEYATTVLHTLGVKNESVDTGVAITLETWFNGKSVQGVHYSITDYPLMEGDRGPRTSCMGTVMWTGGVEDNLFKHTMSNLLGALERVDYRGVINLSLLINEHKVRILEISAGLDDNTIPVLAEIYNGKINDLLYGIACGINKEMRYKSSLGMGVVMSVHPFPCIDCHHGCQPTDIKGLNKHNLKHFWMDNACGRLGMITARGDAMHSFTALRDAKRRIQRTINNLTIHEVMYRTDIGHKVEHDKQQLKTWGWL